MKMLIRTIALYLNYLRCRVKYRKQICFRGFGVMCAMQHSDIEIVGGGKDVLASIQQYDWTTAKMSPCRKKWR